MANKYDLKTWVRQSLVAAATNGALSGAVVGSSTAATGKTRFLTYIRVTRKSIMTAAANSLLIGIGDTTVSTPCASTVLGASYGKLLVFFPGAATCCSPDIAYAQEIHGSIEHPIIAVAGGTYMGIAGASGSTGSSVGVFAQYYDE
jgi:hypothetical protein